MTTGQGEKAEAGQEVRLGGLTLSPGAWAGPEGSLSQQGWVVVDQGLRLTLLRPAEVISPQPHHNPGSGCC